MTLKEKYNMISKKNHIWASLLLFVVPWLISACTGGAKNGQPNIILIMSDDHARQAISAYSKNLIQTPNIDRLAAEGIKFENAFVTNSICAPSRAVILTGKYSHLNGLRDNRDVFDQNQTTFPALLRQAGYYTAIVGKWHLKSKPADFDYWKILPGQGQYYNPTFIEMGDTLQAGGYATTLITDDALRILENRDRRKPFCLLLYHKAPHRNWMPDTSDLELFSGQDLPLPETFFDEYQTRSAAAHEQDMRVAKMWNSFDMKMDISDEDPANTGGKAGFDPAAAWQATLNRLNAEQRTAWDKHYKPLIEDFRRQKLTGKAMARWKYQRYIKDYLRCIASVDRNVGRVLDYLDRSGLAASTIVIYTSDQGFYLGEHGWYDKRFMYEESMSTPLLIRYPGHIRAGSVSQALALNLDFAPTFLRAAGIPVPDEMQGVPLQSLFDGQTPPSWRKAVYYHYYEYPHGWHRVKRHYGIRTDRYKLIHFYNDIDAWELFDLQQDPHELNNLIDQPLYKETVDKLKKQLKQLRLTYQDIEEPPLD